MTAEEMREIIEELGGGRRGLARLLGYASPQSLRQVESGRQALPERKAKWLVRYAAFRRRHDAEHEKWLRDNPVP